MASNMAQIGGAAVAGMLLVSDGLFVAVTQNPASVAALAGVASATVTAVVGPLILQRGNRRGEQLERIEAALSRLDGRLHEAIERVARVEGALFPQQPPRSGDNQ